MTTTAEDISIVLSGGASNLVPNLSIGGPPSATPIINNSLNNLFDDVLAEETGDGIEDYRCFYIFNDGDTSIFDLEIYIFDDFAAGAVLQLGIQDRNEIQRITISDDEVASGSMTISYEGEELVIEHDTDLGVWSTNLQTQLNSLDSLTDVSVTAQNAGSNLVVFDITFTERDGSRNHDLISVVSNDFSPTVTISVTTPQQGSPINTEAPAIDVETTPPGGVLFTTPSEVVPITFPYLAPEEGFPIWVKRIISAGTVAVANDGFILKISAQSLET